MNDLKTTNGLTRELIRKQPEQAREIFDGLPLAERAELVMSRRGRDRLDLILLSVETGELVQALPAPEFWITLKEVDEEDVVELLKLATPDQLLHLSDVEWWHQGAIDPLPAAYWLMLLADAGPETCQAWFNRADEELLIAAFSRFFRVFKIDPDNEGYEPWRNLPNLWTLDGVWFLQFFDPHVATVIERFLSQLRTVEEMRYYALLDLVELSVQTEQEDEAYRFRNARLADFGFVEFDEAMEIYRPISDSELAKMRLKQAGSPGFAPPRFPLALVEAPPLLARALALLSDQAAYEAFALGLASLVSRILVADSLDLARLESLTEAAAKAQSFIELGLRRLGGDDEESAARALVELHPFALFRAGYSRVTELARRTEGLLRAGWPARVKLPRGFLAEDGEMLQGLTRPRPQFYAGADAEGSPVFREFKSAGDVERAGRAVARVETLGLLFFEAMAWPEGEIERLAECRPDGEVSWRTALATAAAQAFAGNDFRFAPLTAADARVALENMLTPERPRALRPDVVAAFSARARAGLERLAAAGPAAVEQGAELVVEALEKTAEEARELDLTGLDPRFFASLVIVSGA